MKTIKYNSDKLDGMSANEMLTTFEGCRDIESCSKELATIKVVDKTAKKQETTYFREV